MTRRRITRDDIERELPLVAGELEHLEHELAALYATRLDLWLAGTRLAPRMTHGELGALSSERAGTVSQALSKHAKANR